MKLFFRCCKVAACFCALFLVACNPVAKTDEPLKNNKLKIVCTTSIITDVVQNICGDKADIVGLMGIGVDPHMFKITQNQMQQINAADVIILNGFFLEGKLTSVLRKLRTQKSVLAFADGVPENELIKITKYDDIYDPHIWFDVDIWKKAITYISLQLQKNDPENAQFFAANTQTYLIQIDNFYADAVEKMNSVSAQNKMMITAHDAFNYFSRSFGIQVKALQSINTSHEFGIKEISQMVDYIIDNEVKLVFLENSVPDKWLQSVVDNCKLKGYDLKVQPGLYSDALGEASANTYLGMMQANIDIIAKAFAE